MKDVPNFGYGRVYSIECHCGMITIAYEVTIEVTIKVIPNYTLS